MVEFRDPRRRNEANGAQTDGYMELGRNSRRCHEKLRLRGSHCPGAQSDQAPGRVSRDPTAKQITFPPADVP